MANTSGANQFRDPEGNPKKGGKVSNQYIKGTRPRVRDKAERDAIRAEFAASRLEDHAKGLTELTDSQVAACKALIPYGKPTLQSVQQTIEEKPTDEGEIVGALAHLIAANPAILRPLIEADPGVRAALKSLIDGVPVAVTVAGTQQSAPQHGVSDASTTKAAS